MKKMDKKFIEELYYHSKVLQTKEEFYEAREWFLNLTEKEFEDIVNWHLLPIEMKKELFPHHIRDFSLNYYDVLNIIPDYFALHPEKEIYKYIGKLLGNSKTHEDAMDCLSDLQDLRAVPLMKKYLESEEKEILNNTIVNISYMFCLESIEALEGIKGKWKKDREISESIDEGIEIVKRGLELVSQFPSYMDWLKDEFKDEIPFREEINTHGAFIIYVDEE